MIAFDTNILVYAQLPKDNVRHEISARIIRLVGLKDGIIALQVIGEFLNVCKAKLKIAPLDAIGQVQDYLEIFKCPQTTATNLSFASLLAEQHMLSYFDALIIAVSHEAGATILLSEDMHDGLEVEGLRIVNPFAAANDALLADYFGSAL